MMAPWGIAVVVVVCSELCGSGSRADGSRWVVDMALGRGAEHATGFIGAKPGGAVCSGAACGGAGAVVNSNA